jgi:hypothetical protein
MSHVSSDLRVIPGFYIHQHGETFDKTKQWNRRKFYLYFSSDLCEVKNKLWTFFRQFFFQLFTHKAL